jgi:hypothetical protein
MTTAERLLRAKQDLDDVYEAGKAQGGGGDSYYDTFWDGFQENGKRINYMMAFAYAWDDDSFQPKYDIVPTTNNSIFYMSKITKLKSILDELGVSLDFSKTNSILKVFQNSFVKEIPVIDARNCTNISYAFNSNEGIETIEKLMLSEKLTTVTGAFLNAINLHHVIFEGTIAISGLDLHWSTKLDAESYDSLIKCYDKTKALTLTLPPEDTVRSVFDAKYGSGSWDAITAEYSNLTISYM